MFYLCTEILVFSSLGLFWISILQHYSNTWVFYSWRAAEICLFRTISLLKIIIDEIISKLEKNKFIDDDRYSSTKIVSLSNSGRSKNFIFNYLIKKGVSKSQIQNNFNLMQQDNDNWELESARIFAKKKKLLEKNESYEKKLAKMARAGFSYDICKKILS